MKSEVAQSCPTLCNLMDCSLPGSSIHGIFQAIILEWIAISFSRGSSPPRDWTWVSRIVDRHFTVWATREVLKESIKCEVPPLPFSFFLVFYFLWVPKSAWERVPRADMWKKNLHSRFGSTTKWLDGIRQITWRLWAWSYSIINADDNNNDNNPPSLEQCSRNPSK